MEEIPPRKFGEDRIKPKLVSGLNPIDPKIQLSSENKGFLKI